VNIFAKITKIDASRREVHGVMAEESPDKAGEVFDYATSKPYVMAWSNDAMTQTALSGQDISFGNVRAQHNAKIAAGKLVSIDFDDDAKKIPIIAKIVDDAEWTKITEGVYTGFSIGGDYVKRWQDGGNIRYTANPKEVSIVDNPCMYGATFSMVKADGSTVERQFHSNDLATLTSQITEIVKTVAAVVKARQVAPKFDPNDLDGELRKALAAPKSPEEIEADQARSARFVPRYSRHHGSDSPWL
jgi:hypothetical protein